ncbi:hypothetical protein [Pseudomonas rhodesiae]|uniref:hypothetical protein n=1 Tax=Pseudomonas rhodesiae TaxID=76760 RepID=UPI000AD07F79|nr:hypothetical protein [Pseudomonas rhodesiae]
MNEKDSSRESPLCGRAAEADFGELRYLNAARLKAGAHYTGNSRKRELFLSAAADKRAAATLLKTKSIGFVFTKARPRWLTRLNVSLNL